MDDHANPAPTSLPPPPAAALSSGCSGVASAKACSVSGGYSRVRSTVQRDRGEQHDRTEVEGVVESVGHDSVTCGIGAVVADAEPREQRRQAARHDRAEADEETLHRIAGRALRRPKLVADEGAERFHRHVDGRIQEPQQAGRDPQHAGSWHRQQRDRGEDRADEKVRPAPAKARPGAVGVVADDRLHQQSRQRRRDPQRRNGIEARAQRLENAADVRVLQREAELKPKEPEAHVPDLPESQCRTCVIRHARATLGCGGTHPNVVGTCAAVHRGAQDPAAVAEIGIETRVMQA